MKNGPLSLAVALSWIVTMWAIAVAVSVSQQEGDGGGKNGAYDQGYASASGSVAGTAADIASNQDATGNNQGQSNEKNSGNGWQTWFNFMVGLATAAQAVLIYFQVKINRGQHSTQRAELRAYVSFFIDNLGEMPIPGIAYRIVFSCRNWGKTPALDVGFAARIARVTMPITVTKLPTIGPKFDEQTVNLFPDEDMATPRRKKFIEEHRGRFFPVNTATVFTAAEIQSVKDRTHAFVVGLKIRYRDVFNEWHETQEFYAIAWADSGTAVYLIPGGSVIT